jgi:phosphohistidine phosphatase
MKRLFLIRHAKSSWADPALPDKDRPLGDRGRRDAPKMGTRLAKRDVKPDLILSSPARRALMTAEIIAKNDRLYAGAVNDLLNVIHKLGDKLERVMLFGHNPELPSSRIGFQARSPTCQLAPSSLCSVRSRGQTSARPSSQKWRSIIQRNRRAKHSVSDEGGLTPWRL